MLPHGGTVERMGALRRDVRPAQRLHAGGGVVEIEHDVVERRSERRILKMRELGHLEVNVLVIDGDVAEESVKDGHGQLPPALGAGGVARRVGSQRGRQ